MKSLETFEEIIMYLSILRYIFKSRSKRNLYDLNKQAENFFKDVLNLIYDLNLKNLNEEKENFPAIDLGDDIERVSYQVTATNSSEKIKKSIKKFTNNNLHNRFDILKILIITEKKSYTTDFSKKTKFNFSKDNIIDIDDLLEDIEKLKIDKLITLQKYIEKELPNIKKLFAPKESLLSNIEVRPNFPAKNALKFLKEMDYEEYEFSDELIYITELYNKLIELPERTREFLYVIIERGEESTAYSISGKIGIHYQELEHITRLPREKSQNEFQILERKGLAYYEEEDNNIYISTPSMSDNLFSLIKDFSKKDTLKNIIVGCDFRLLDE